MTDEKSTVIILSGAGWLSLMNTHVKLPVFPSTVAIMVGVTVSSTPGL